MARRIRQAGFTLGELITVLAIWGVVAGVAAPIASAILHHHRMVTASRQLAFEIARARMQAVGQNTFVRIVLIAADEYGLEISSDGATYVRDGPTVILPVGVTITAGQTGAPRFDRQGLAPVSTALTLSGPAGRRTLSTNVLGRVTHG